MYYCCVKNCSSKNDHNNCVSFHSFPMVNYRYNRELQKLLKQRREAWCAAVGKINPTRHHRICSKHFKSGKPSDFRDVNNVDWLPNMNINTTNQDVTPKSKVNRRTLVRYRPALKKRKVFPENEVEVNSVNWYDENESMEGINILPVNDTRCDDKIGQDVETNVTVEYVKSLEQEIRARNEEVYHLRETIEKLSWSETTFKNDETKFRFYTGLASLDVFLLILKYVNISLESLNVANKKCSNFQKLLLTLMKLRHNTSFTGLGYRFQVHVRDASYIFKNVCIILYETFKYMVHWPDRESLRARVPECFKNVYGNKVTIIIDCFEIGSERPATVRAKAQTYSNNKGRNTTKYLIGITQQGYISFISDGYGGRVTDKYITEHCGILNNLLPGDVILADRGFDISALVASYQAKLNIPTFTRGINQLHPTDIEKPRKVANVRIHVERVIGLLRNKFKILSSMIPVKLLKEHYNNHSLIDIIVYVCCILINMCEPVIPMKSEFPKKYHEFTC